MSTEVDQAADAIKVQKAAARFRQESKEAFKAGKLAGAEEGLEWIDDYATPADANLVAEGEIEDPAKFLLEKYDAVYSEEWSERIVADGLEAGDGIEYLLGWNAGFRAGARNRLLVVAKLL